MLLSVYWDFLITCVINKPNTPVPKTDITKIYFNMYVNKLSCPYPVSLQIANIEIIQYNNSIKITNIIPNNRLSPIFIKYFVILEGTSSGLTKYKIEENTHICIPRVAKIILINWV